MQRAETTSSGIENNEEFQFLIQIFFRYQTGNHGNNSVNVNAMLAFYVALNNLNAEKRAKVEEMQSKCRSGLRQIKSSLISSAPVRSHWRH